MGAEERAALIAGLRSAARQGNLFRRDMILESADALEAAGEEIAALEERLAQAELVSLEAGLRKWRPSNSRRRCEPE